MNSSLVVFNSLTSKKETFKSISPNKVGMYVCGPTVYSNVHLGNCRTFISFDLIFRYLQHLGYKVRYVRNITDVGHLENDSDYGEDRIAKKARLESIEPMEVVQRYTLDFRDTMTRFNALPPSIEPTATGHIVEQIELIKKIINQGDAYEVNGSVYFDISCVDDFGALCRLEREEMIDLASERGGNPGDPQKRDPLDFVLWQPSLPDEPAWESRWGSGRPGWHVECSVLAMRDLESETIDLHGGGADLIFPHHEAEITQSNACNNCSPVNYWMHNNMVTIDGKKMGKSLGNFINLEEFFTGKHEKLDRAYSPMTIRFFMLQAHYRSTLDFGNEALQAAEKGLNRLLEAKKTLKNLSPSSDSSFNVGELEKKCFEAINDDFNTPILIANLFEGVKVINSIKDQKANLNSEDLNRLKKLFDIFINEILGLKEQENTTSNDVSDDIMQVIFSLRNNAKKNKDFATADFIRDELEKKGIQIKDSREGSSWSLEN